MELLDTAAISNQVCFITVCWRVTHCYAGWATHCALPCISSYALKVRWEICMVNMYRISLRICQCKDFGNELVTVLIKNRL